jgi:endonuclease-3
MLKLPVAEIQRVIRPCGLAPAKARAIAGLSKILVEQHAGRVPANFEALEALPGVGHKTASVVMVQAHGQPAFPVDTHIHRLAARWGLSNGRSVEQTERDLKRLFPEPTWGRVHLQIILFGRSHCPARGHDLTMCPICSWAASKARIRAETPAKRTARKTARRPISRSGSRARAAGRARPRRARAAARRSRPGSW